MQKRIQYIYFYFYFNFLEVAVMKNKLKRALAIALSLVSSFIRVKSLDRDNRPEGLDEEFEDYDQDTGCEMPVDPGNGKINWKIPATLITSVAGAEGL